MEDKRKENLDRFFLVFPPLLGVVFSLLFGKHLYLLLPSLVLGWLMPVYVGYWRGSIKLDSLAERVRGAPYLWVGMLSYGFFALLVMVVEPLMMEVPFDEIILFALIFLLLPLLLWPRIRRGLVELLDEGSREKVVEALSSSWVAAECLVVSIYGFIVLANILLRYRWRAFGGIGGLILTIVLFVASALLLWKFFDKEIEARDIIESLDVARGAE